MGKQSASRLGGDDYQHLFSWCEILQRLMPEESPFECAMIEHPGAGAADDLTFHAQAGAQASDRFVQVKWHVDLAKLYSFESLRTPEGNRAPIITRLYDSWKTLRQQGHCEVWLISNQSPAPAPDLGKYVSGRDGKLRDAFFQRKAPSPVAKERKLLADAVGATEGDLLEFCRDLRFQLGSRDLAGLHALFDREMALCMFMNGENARAAVVQELRERIQEGGDAVRLTKHVVSEIVDRRGLRKTSETVPDVCLCVHGWCRQIYDVSPTTELDWTGFFDRRTRRVATNKEWNDTLWPQLLQVRDAFAMTPGGKSVDVRGRFPLTTALAIGAAFPHVGGFNVRVEQPTSGVTHLWRSDAVASDMVFEVLKEDVEDDVEEIVLALCVTGNGLTEAERLLNRLGLGAICYAEPKGGANPSAVMDASDAVALARDARRLVQHVRRVYRIKTIHLVLYCPASIALFLGQGLNSVGTVYAYERTMDGGYEASVKLETG